MKNRIISISLAVVLAISIGLVGCGGEEAPEIAEYNLTISSTEGGSVTSPSEGTSTYDEGTAVNLVAEAEEGYRFVNWTGDVSTIADVEDARTTIIMDAPKSVTANFAPLRSNLVVDSTEGGSVITPGEGTFTYDYGTVVDLVATPLDGYQFVEWTGDAGTVADVSDASTTVTMNGDCSITASFAIGIHDWYDLDAIRDDLSGSYILMNNLDATTPGYMELAGDEANDGKGWDPFGYEYSDDSILFLEGFNGTFIGRGYEIRDIFVDRPSESFVGLFGYVDGGTIEDVSVANAIVIGDRCVGGLVGSAWGNVKDSYFSGIVTGNYSVGGLVGENGGTVSNSHYNFDEVLINGENVITIGALFDKDFEEWLTRDKYLDVDERLSQEDGYYVLNNINDFKELLAFGQDNSLRFKLKTDVDLATEPDFYIPYLAGEFDGNGHKVSNLNLDLDFASQLGLFGYLASGGEVSGLYVENANTTSDGYSGGLVGMNMGTISNSHSTGSLTSSSAAGGVVGANYLGTVTDCHSSAQVTSDWRAGGLVGGNWRGTVSNSYSTGSVNGGHYVGGLAGDNAFRGNVTQCYSTSNVVGGQLTGGLVGYNWYSLVSNSYSTGNVVGQGQVGGLVGRNTGDAGIVSNSYSTGSVAGSVDVGGLVGVNSFSANVTNSFWDVETSGIGVSDGGTGKTTAEMKSNATFSTADWNIIAVANPDARNPSYIWNIVDGQTYPFLSWQSVS